MLVPLLDVRDAPLVRELGLRALMHLTYEKAGKVAALKFGCVERCIGLLNRPEIRDTIRSFTCLLVSNLAEHPDTKAPGPSDAVGRQICCLFVCLFVCLFF